MKTIKFTVIAFAAMLLSTSLMAQDNKQQLVIPLSDPGKPYKLDVALVRGSIKVTGYEGKDVIIDATGEDRKKKEDHENGNGMKRLSGADNLDVIAREKHNTVTVNSEQAKFANLVIKIPQGASNIKLHTINDGNIVASDIGGELEISNVNGSISLLNVSGSVVANTVNGKVQVTFKSINPNAAMAFSTLNGNVDVTFPASLKANVKMRSDRGEVYSDFDVATDKSEPKATKTAKDGMYRISIEDWIYGKVNGGGPEMLMKTMNGNIYVRKAK
jgi:hypothetical protein